MSHFRNQNIYYQISEIICFCANILLAVATGRICKKSSDNLTIIEIIELSESIIAMHCYLLFTNFL